jgi:S1-C subfamily serine protease
MSRRLPLARLATSGLLLACGALIPAAAAAQQDPTPPPRRARIVRTDSTRDSSIVRVTIDAGQIGQMIRELMTSRAMEETIGQSLRDAASGQSGDAKKMRELSDELGRIAQKRAAMITTLEMTCSRDRQPDGYLGVQFSELQTVMGDDAPQSPLLHEYPRIDSVYPGSPASKAGVHRGDVVLMIGGQDARKAVQLDKLLKPMTRVPVRVRRDGAQKELTITVEKRPGDFNAECENVDQFIAPEFDQPMIAMRSRTPLANGGAKFFTRTPSSDPSPEAPPMPPMPPAAGFMYGFANANSAIAGATLMPLDDDWRATLGVDNGVLVTKVLPGTPAKDAGLHASDVIISADGQTITSVRALSRIVSNAKANAVRLQVIRAGKPLVVMLRWQEQP